MKLLRNIYSLHPISYHLPYLIHPIYSLIHPFLPSILLIPPSPRAGNRRERQQPGVREPAVQPDHPRGRSSGHPGCCRVRGWPRLRWLRPGHLPPRQKVFRWEVQGERERERVSERERKCDMLYWPHFSMRKLKDLSYRFRLIQTQALLLLLLPWTAKRWAPLRSSSKPGTTTSSGIPLASQEMLSCRLGKRLFLLVVFFISRDHIFYICMFCMVSNELKCYSKREIVLTL